jgi:hypothetical protein
MMARRELEVGAQFILRAEEEGLSATFKHGLVLGGALGDEEAASCRYLEAAASMSIAISRVEKA